MGRKKEGSAEKTFKNMGKKVDEMMEELQKLKERAKQKFPGETAELKRNIEKLENEIKDFRENHKERFEEIENRLEKAGQEMKNAFKTLFR